MRVALFLALLCVVVSVSGQTVTRQGYFNGTATPGGCGTINVNDTQVFPLGVCINTTEAGDPLPNSMIINECAANGLITASVFNGSATCDLAFARGLLYVSGVINSAPFCNVDTTHNTYNTWTCSSVPYPTSSPGTLKVTAYAFAYPLNATNSANNNCNKTLAPQTIDFSFNLTTCNPVATLTATYGILPTCSSNGAVTAIFYDNSACTVSYSNTTQSFTNAFIVPIGPYAQTGKAVTGVAPAAFGSDCGLVPNFSFMNFTCAINPAPTTPVPTTPAPTPKPSNSSSTGGSVNNHAATIMYSMAALVAPILAIIFA